MELNQMKQNQMELKQMESNQMEDKKGRKLKPLALMAAISLALTLFIGSGLFRRADYALSDGWYQRGIALDGNIVLVGIDQRALEEFGPYNQWGRGIMAQVLEALNQSEECRPAVIGIDVFYSGETDPEADGELARAAETYGNVVTACAAEFGRALVPYGDKDYYADDFSLLSFETPYDSLRQATRQGHINAMMDPDGILRHHFLRMELPDGRVIPSMALALAQAYREAQGEPLTKLPPTDSRGFWYLPYAGKPGVFDESISVADVLSGKRDAGYFAGKIVLIGPYAPGLQDSYLTSADHARPMYGMEYQANAVQALLQENFKREAGRGGQLAVLFAVLFGAMAAFWKRPVKLATAVWAGVLAGYLILCRWLYGRGLVLHVLWVPLGVTVVYVASLGANYIRAAMEKLRVTKTFKRYVAPEIVNEILKEGTDALELGGKLTRIAVLFVDVRGFTPMSELLSPPQVVEILNRYLTLISDCILKNGGTLDKFVGDAAMAFWGAPLPQEDFVMGAARAAMDMAQGAEGLAGELMERYGRTVSFGIGVHVGEAVVGNIGSPKRMDYTAIGDTVNTAARLEANAPGGTVYISRAVADELKGRIKTTSLGDSVKLKGKKEGFEVLVLEEIIK